VKGHNSGPISADRLKSFVERIEKLEEERKAIGGDIKDVYSEAKGVGYDVKTMRKIVALRQMDAAARAEAETLLDVYRHALGMESNTTPVPQEPTEEELEERAGRIIGEVDRCMALVVDGKPPKIEAIKELIGCSAGKAHKLRGFVADRISSSNAVLRENENPPASSGSQAAKANDAESPQGPLTTPDLADAAGGVDAPAPIPETPGADLAGDGAGTGVASAPAPAVANIPKPDIAIPAFLDRRPQVPA